MKREPMKRSDWLLVSTYISAGLAIAVPPVGVVCTGVSAFFLRKALKDEEADRKIAEEAARKEFKRKFYARQQFASYEDYLGSSVWKAKRVLVIDRCGGRCEELNCTGPADEVHHNYYPRVWGKESIQSLVGLCERHHRERHGLLNDYVKS